MEILREYIASILKSSSILVPPPPPIEERLKELDYIQSQRIEPFNEKELQESLDNDIDGLFNYVTEKYEGKNCLGYVNELKKKVEPVILYHKMYFNSPRPNQLAAAYGIPFDYDKLSSAQTPSYPSGHAAQAYYIAEKLSEIFPNSSGKFSLVAEMIAQSRIDRGVHFPSDIISGKILAEKMLLVDLENIKEAAVVRIDPKADRMLKGVRSALGEKEFIASLLAKIDSRDLKRMLRSIAHDKNLEIDGIQYT